jgi:hypothetical protein
LKSTTIRSLQLFPPGSVSQLRGALTKKTIAGGRHKTPAFSLANGFKLLMNCNQKSAAAGNKQRFTFEEQIRFQRFTRKLCSPFNPHCDQMREPHSTITRTVCHGV